MNIDGNTNGRITKEELQEVVSEMKNGKAPEQDQISVEMMKNITPEGKEMLHQLINKIWIQNKISKD